MEPDAKDQRNPVHHSLSSSYHLFSGQPITGYTNNNNIGGGGVGEDTIRRRFEMRETIRREIEKERIREEILAEEMALRRVLEAEVRNELMMERHMVMRRSGGGFAAPFMHLQAPSQKNVFEQKFLQPRLVGAEDKRVMSVDDKFGRGDGFFGVKGVSVKPIQVLADSARIKAVSAENNKETLLSRVLCSSCPSVRLFNGKPDGESRETLSGTKRKSTPPVSEGSTEPGPLVSDRSMKKVKEEWSCAICQVSTTSECGLTQHIQGKKHRIKEAALVAQKTGSNVGLGVAPNIPLIKPLQRSLTTINTSSSETNKPSSSSDPNEVNKKDVVGAFSEAVMNDHKEGKKHLTRLVGFYGKGKVDSEASATENTCDTNDKTETKSKQAVVIATVTAEVKTVEDDVAYVAAKTAEENDTTTG
ncbi:hypothetical protein M8C21_001336 [Ambrosia artemisiifolia]|uniref:C2H2-type domain-containing protein n=1 Tax=Ambrosia artemisiifolia TaxID=4212 RepID=A0AAD5D1E9_AMBAR|nr:hypothetical protein M8C21_001336 [Ambrosia artemisiifolia]